MKGYLCGIHFHICLVFALFFAFGCPESLVGFTRIFWNSRFCERTGDMESRELVFPSKTRGADGVCTVHSFKSGSPVIHSF